MKRDLEVWSLMRRECAKGRTQERGSARDERARCVDTSGAASCRANFKSRAPIELSRAHSLRMALDRQPTRA
jgi:hypothetical protein